MAGEEWTNDEIAYLMSSYQGMNCQKIAEHIGRSVKSVQHKFGQLGLERRKAQVGDIVNGWEIIGITSRKSGNQSISYAQIRSTLDDRQEKECRLTNLTLSQIGWPDRRRPDNILRNTTHNESDTRLYSIWAGMKTRCLNKKQVSYPDYGGRGIMIIEDWLKFENFRDWANANGYSEELTLDRKDPNGNYCPENCQWSNWTTQIENRRISKDMEITAFNETKSVYQWKNDDRCNVSVTCLYYRIKSGWDEERAITEISKRKKKERKLDVWLKQYYPSIYDEYTTQ